MDAPRCLPQMGQSLHTQSISVGLGVSIKNMNKSEIARALNALRKTHAGPALKQGTPEEMERRKRKREVQQRWRKNQKKNPA